MTGFEVFDRALVQATKEPTLTIQKNGIMSLNKPEEVALDSPTAVELLFDRARHRIGLRATEPTAATACALRAVAGPGAAPFVVSAARFLRSYSIRQAVSRRWIAYLEAGILCVDLDSESTVVTSNRAKIPVVTGK